MTQSLLAYSMFHDVLFPPSAHRQSAQSVFALQRHINFRPDLGAPLWPGRLVVFDLETTGLDSGYDEIIEIGAQKFSGGRVIDEMTSLIACPMPLPPEIQKITGITDAMLVGQPPLAEVLTAFLRFIDGCILVAHNAVFDLGFIKAACQRQGIVLDWPAICTLKMARVLLPDIERRNLDTLARHYGLTFESRHRSIGDVKVTAAVLREFLHGEGSHLQTWSDVAPFTVT